MNTEIKSLQSPSFEAYLAYIALKNHSLLLIQIYVYI